MFVYILYSKKLSRYYVGFSIDVSHRLDQHNSGISKYTSRGIPWHLVHVIEVEDEKSARQLEQQIKGRGIKRYLSDIGFVG